MARPLDGLSARRITLSLLAIILALFAVVTVSPAPTQAQAQAAPPPDGTAAWAGEDIRYGATTLSRYDTPPPLDAIDFPNRDQPDNPCRDSSPLFYSQILEAPAAELADPVYSEDRYWMHLICLDEGADESDKTQPIGATLISYSILKEDVSDVSELDGGDLTSRVIHSIQIYPEGETPESVAATSAEGVTTCDSTYTHGIGWIICPVTNWLASGMDMLYGILSRFLVVEPLSTTQDSPLYNMWSLMRNFANIMFIIGFLIIVYSQITSIGLSSHGVKRLLPRLIIAAVLVNISYWITALAVDLSNVIGVSLYDLLARVRDDVLRDAPSNLGEVTWEGVSGVMLSGGAAAVGAIGLAAGAVASAGGSLFFLSVVLMGAIVSALVAVLVLAARQALITVLIIVSPLAFVAYLLPSTEKYFDRWRGLFTTMMLVYPAFSLVFGGAQLAGLAIMYAADPGNENYFNLIVLGMAVQVAPLVITPLLLKLSGSLIGRIAGIVNDPNRGIIDRTRKFAQDRHDMRKNRQLWERDKRTGKYAHNNPLARSARWIALRETDRQHKIKTYEGGLEAAYAESEKSKETHAQAELNEMTKSAGQDEAKTEFAQSIGREDSLLRIYTLQQLRHEEAERMENKNKTAYEAVKTKPGVANAAIRDLANRAHEVSNEAVDETQRLSAINQEHDNQYWRNLTSDPTRQAYAGAAGIAEYGEERIVNIAQQKQVEERNKRISAAISTLDKEEAKLREEKAVILADAANAGKFTYLTSDLDSRSGAVRHYVERAPIKLIQELMTELDITIEANGDPAAEVLRSELAGALKKRKPFYVSLTNLNKIAEGTLESKYKGTDGRDLMIQETLNAKGLGTETMVTADRDDLQAVRDYLRKYGIGSLDADAQKALRDSLTLAFGESRFSSKMDKRAIELEEIRSLI